MAIVPVINVASDSEGFAPFTVHVNVDIDNSNFDGVPIEDCIFEWDFGDLNPPLNGHQDNNRYDSLGSILDATSLVQGNYKNKTRFCVPTLDSGTDNTGYSDRSGDSNSKQQGINAAYTYYHNNEGTPFTITLSVIHNGVATNKVSVDITVNEPVIYETWTSGSGGNDILNPLHAVNSSDSWVSIVVNSSYSDNPSSGSSRNFETINDAFEWIDNFRSSTSPGGVNGRCRIVLSNLDDQYEFVVSDEIIVTQSDIVIAVLDYSKNRSFKIIPSETFDAGSFISMFTFDDGVRNVYVENIQFVGIKSPYNSSLSETTNVNPIHIHEANNITLHNCSIYGCSQGIYVDTSGFSCIYINLFYTPKEQLGYVSKNSLFTLYGSNIVLSNVEVSNFNSRTLYNKQGYILDVGVPFYCSIQWCYIDAAMTSDSLYASLGTAEKGGSIYATRPTYSTITSNMFIRGCNVIAEAQQTRIDGNYISVAGGGQKVSPIDDSVSSKASGLSVIGDSSNLCIVNNVFDLKYNHIMGNAFSTDSFPKYDIKIANNTILVQKNVSYLISVWDFSDLDETYADIIFCNNVFIENRVATLSRMISLNFDLTSIKSNVYSEKPNNVRFALKNEVGKSVSDWISSYGDSDYFYTVELEDAIISRGFVFDINKYGFLNTIGTICNFVNQDYTKTARPVGDASVGCSIPLDYNDFFRLSSSTTPMQSVITNVLRNRPKNSNVPANDSNNLYLEVYDPDMQTKDDTGVISSKRLIGKSYGTSSSDVSVNYINLLNDVGDYIKTEITTEQTNEGVNITVLYSNDGPSVQTDGIVEQRLGSIDFDYIFVGRNSSILNNKNCFSVIDNSHYSISTYSTSSDALVYPFSRFAPITTYLTKTHAITISILADFLEKDKAIKESTSGRFDSYNYPIGRAKTNLSWWNNSFNNHCLKPGESFKVIISLVISRNPSKWIVNTKPLKDYLQTNNEMKHSRDPRPISFESLISNPDNSTSLDMNLDYLIPQNGYANYRSTAIDTIIDQHYERYMVLNILGKNTGGLNPYPQISTPLYRDQTPWTTYPNMLISVNEISRISEEIPSFIFYQGYGDLTLTSTVAYGGSCTYGSIDFLNNARMQKFYDEMDFLFDVFWASGVSLGSYGTNVIKNQIKNSTDLLETYHLRYPNSSIFVEKLLDLYCFRAASLVSSDSGIYCPNHLANYLIPGNEIVCSYTTLSNQLDEIENVYEIMYKAQVLAEYGYVSGVYDTFQHGTDLIVDSSFLARDRRFDYEIASLDYTPLSAPEIPSNIEYGFYNGKRSEEYIEIRKKYIKLSWNQSSETDFSHYIVYKSKVTNQVVDSNENNFQRRKYTKNPVFYDTAVRENNTYYYQIASVDVFGNESSRSDVISVPFVSDDSSLTPPANISASSNNGSISISWSS